jgi:hypothetical protein
MLLPIILLGLSICLVWAPNTAFGRALPAPAWAIMFLAAVISGTAYGILAWPALVALALLAAAAWLSQRLKSRVLRVVATVIAVLLALALAQHRVPGFTNPVLIAGAQLSEDAAPYTRYASFDKGAAGLFLLVFFSQRASSLDEWRRIAGPTLVFVLLTSFAAMTVALASGYVRLEPKLPAAALAFLPANLLLTCVAEEAFFRGLIQERMTRALETRPGLRWLPVAVSSLLFGLAHGAGGPIYVALATLAGLGYALAYAVTRRIEAAVLTHFAVNAVHFLGFTYPHLQG